MLRDVVFASVLLAVVSGSAFAANKSSGDSAVARAGGLMCFSVTPPKGGGPSCDALCAAKDAVCVGLKMNSAVNPGFGCADAIDLLRGGNEVAGCRCCAVAH